MANRVSNPNEIYLNATRFRTVGPVRSGLSSVYPQKEVFGDYGRDSNPNASIVAWSDWSAGIGLETMDKATETNRAWWSTLSLRHPGHLVLPGLATLTANPSVSGAWTVGAMAELASEVYAAFGTTVKKYNNSTDSWGSSLHTLPSAATWATTVRMGGTVYIVFYHTTGYSYSANGSSWTDDTEDMIYGAWLDDKLWGIDSTGTIRRTVDLVTWADSGQLPLEGNAVNGMFVADSADGDATIYVPTDVGLYAYDIDNGRFIPTRVTLPRHPDNGLGSTTWRESSFIPSGLAVYQYITSNRQAALSVMGPDRDDGVPSDKRGRIVHMVGGHNELFAAVDATTAPGSLDMFASGQSPVIDDSAGFSYILGWNGQGWEVKWLGGTSAKTIDYMLVSTAYSVYRLWWSHNNRIYYTRLERDITNPNQVTDFPYALTGEHETPWFTAGQSEVTKTALRIHVEGQNMSSSEVYTLYYATDYSDTYTQLGDITSDGVTTYQLPDSTTPTGVDFRSIRLKAIGQRGTTNTLSPDIVFMGVEFRKKLPSRWSHQVTILIDDSFGQSAQQKRAAAITAVESTTLVEFTFRDDDGNTRNYYVDVISPSAEEITGHDERGQTTLQLVER